MSERKFYLLLLTYLLLFFLCNLNITVPNFSGLSRYQEPCPEKSRNTINLSRIKAFCSTFEENPKFLFFHSPNLFVYKLTSSSRASSTIFKYFKPRRWCLLKTLLCQCFFTLTTSSSRSLPWKPRGLMTLRVEPVQGF